MNAVRFCQAQCAVAFCHWSCKLQGLALLVLLAFVVVLITVLCCALPLLSAAGAKRVLEVGMFTGTNSLAMAEVLPQDGQVREAASPKSICFSCTAVT
jgi:hypothetical protein